MLLISANRDVFRRMNGNDVSKYTSKDRFCQVSGAIRITAELLAFIYTVWYSFIIKKMVSDPTYNSKKLTLISHISTFLISAIMVILVQFMSGFGISVTN